MYPKVCEIIDQEDLTVTYTSFGGVPEPRQLSGSRASTGNRQAKSLADYTLTGTVVEWEDTVTLPRAVIETNPQEIGRITTQMAQKASMFMDRQLIATALPSTTALGYDGIALYSTAHAETGSSQDNRDTHNVTLPLGSSGTGAELEAAIGDHLGLLANYTDDVGTPVNAGVSRYTLLCEPAAEFFFKNLVGTANTASASLIQGTDVTGGTGKFRGMFDVIGSPFVTADRYYIFAIDAGTKAVALLKNKDWDFKSNMGTDSDLWNYEQTALFTAYARWQYVPWNWKVTISEELT